MVSIGIVGAGFSGLGMAIQLQKAGFQDFTIFEAADDIGGTWRANTYPGCACDIQSVMYCFSFEPYPWTQHYSEQPEILRYLHHCADKYKLWDNIQLNTRVTGAAWDEDRALWRLSTASGVHHEVQVLVLAQGPLSIPVIPDLPGLSGFKGDVMHTAAWNSSIQLEGKKVAVVGTGASSIQAVPRLQQVAKELVVFQRTPPWILPREELAPKYAVPAAQHGHRLTLWLQRLAVFWRNELLIGTTLVGNRNSMLRRIEDMALKNMQAAVSDPTLRAALTPDYSLGCKRILGSDDYYPALAQPNVQLVSSGLKRVLPDGRTLEADNGDVITDVDVIVFATGFDIKAPLGQFQITARGSDLKQVMYAKPEAYYGTAMAGFPNLFTMLGLNTGLGHHSVVFMAECQINLIIRLLKAQLLQQQNDWVEVTPEAQHSFNVQVQQRLKSTVWLSGCRSWYLTNLDEESKAVNGSSQDDSSKVAAASSSGSKGEAAASSSGVVMWPGLCVEYWWKTLWPVAGHWKAGRATHAAAENGGGRTGHKSQVGAVKQ